MSTISHWQIEQQQQDDALMHRIGRVYVFNIGEAVTNGNDRGIVVSRHPGVDVPLYEIKHTGGVVYSWQDEIQIESEGESFAA